MMNLNTEKELDNYLNRFLQPFSNVPNCSNYRSACKLTAEQQLAAENDEKTTFYLTESLAPALRSLANYRYDKVKAEDPDDNIKYFIPAVQKLIEENRPTVKSIEIETAFCFLDLDSVKIDSQVEEEPFHQRYLRFTSANNSSSLNKLLRDLPKEWTVLQLTAPYNPEENFKILKDYRSDIKSIYLSILKNDYLDSFDLDPFTIDLPSNVVQEGEKPLLEELHSLLEDNIKTIDTDKVRYNKNNVHKYWEQREEIDLRMKSVIQVMENNWLGGLRCLLTGGIESSDLRNDLKRAVDKVCADWGFIRISKKQKFLICNLLECSHSIQTDQTRRALRTILTQQVSCKDLKASMRDPSFIGCGSCDENVVRVTRLCIKCLAGCFKVMHNFNLVDVLKPFSELSSKIKNETFWGELKNIKRYPVILIVDEWLDTFPWESMAILSNHPVSRMESIHFLYALYKTNEEHIENGYYVIRPDNGFYLINPGNNLDRMEKRMSSFIKYWCPKWCGETNKAPDPEDFVRELKNTDMFLYCGHGDGSEYTRGSGVTEAGRVKGTALLAGCASTRTAPQFPRASAAPSHYHYHTVHCPLVIGMLWEVTDYEVDKVVSSLIALTVPSEAPVPWFNVGKKEWSEGVLEINTENNKDKVKQEPDVLLAITAARRTSSFLMIATSVVARGLPIKIMPA